MEFLDGYYEGEEAPSPTILRHRPKQSLERLSLASSEKIRRRDGWWKQDSRMHNDAHRRSDPGKTTGLMRGSDSCGKQASHFPPHQTTKEVFKIRHWRLGQLRATQPSRATRTPKTRQRPSNSWPSTAKELEAREARLWVLPELHDAGRSSLDPCEITISDEGRDFFYPGVSKLPSLLDSNEKINENTTLSSHHDHNGVGATPDAGAENHDSNANCTIRDESVSAKRPTAEKRPTEGFRLAAPGFAGWLVPSKPPSTQPTTSNGAVLADVLPMSYGNETHCLIKPGNSSARNSDPNNHNGHASHGRRPSSTAPISQLPIRRTQRATKPTRQKLTYYNLESSSSPSVARVLEPHGRPTDGEHLPHTRQLARASRARDHHNRKDPRTIIAPTVPRNAKTTHIDLQCLPPRSSSKAHTAVKGANRRRISAAGSSAPRRGRSSTTSATSSSHNKTNVSMTLQSSGKATTSKSTEAATLPGENNMRDSSRNYLCSLESNSPLPSLHHDRSATAQLRPQSYSLESAPSPRQNETIGRSVTPQSKLRRSAAFRSRCTGSSSGDKRPESSPPDRQRSRRSLDERELRPVDQMSCYSSEAHAQSQEKLSRAERVFALRMRDIAAARTYIKTALQDGSSSKSETKSESEPATSHTGDNQKDTCEITKNIKTPPGRKPPSPPPSVPLPADPPTPIPRPYSSCSSKENKAQQPLTPHQIVQQRPRDCEIDSTSTRRSTSSSSTSRYSQSSPARSSTTMGIHDSADIYTAGKYTDPPATRLAGPEIERAQTHHRSPSHDINQASHVRSRSGSTATSHLDHNRNSVSASQTPSASRSSSRSHTSRSVLHYSQDLHSAQHLEARIATLERQNKMLQAALIAALDVGVTFDADVVRTGAVHSPAYINATTPTASVIGGLGCDARGVKEANRASYWSVATTYASGRRDEVDTNGSEPDQSSPSERFTDQKC
ncbi:hypothetical protein AJ80_01909 [Polytolypa hystricis UAMH7299]|uniref:Uncharacterized protein n=1 Tax=Polytolypa hystricis (strain UAMH7299) TaxID=1447883 RepID=A0A2B7YZD8_POLH7|nr:hypothetical protein AJ80_01909 [Polytolypa hystricis UAMH7299]